MICINVEGYWLGVTQANSTASVVKTLLAFYIVSLYKQCILIVTKIKEENGFC